MSWTQLELFPLELVHRPTIAETRGETAVMQCLQCGTLVATHVRVKLGACPSCSSSAWKRQPTEVGPFRKAD